MPYTTIFDWVRDLLNEDFDDLPDQKLLRYVDSAVNLLVSEYTGIGSYASLAGTDLTFFDEAVGHFVAIRLRPSREKAVPVGDLVRVHTQNTHFQFSEPGKSGRKSLEEQWLAAARLALGRVTAVKNYIQAQTSFNRFVVSGPTRTQRANGITETLMTALLRPLTDSDEAFVSNSD